VVGLVGPLDGDPPPGEWERKKKGKKRECKIGITEVDLVIGFGPAYLRQTVMLRILFVY